jgi:L-fuculose-phosphate aldolase
MLRFPSYADEQQLRGAIIECGRICYERHLLTSNDGNISVRLDEKLILITPSGLSKGRMESSDLIVMDLQGNVHQSPKGRRPSSETPMHLEVYKQRPDVRAVIHAHPVFATALTVAGLEFPADVLPEVMLTLGDVPVSAYAMPSSHEDADVVRPLIRDHDAILLRQHGSLTVGKDLEEALIALERVEHVAEVFWRARAMGHVERIPPAVGAKLAELREQFFKK